MFGDEKVENLNKYNKEGDTVTVEFNVNTNEWKGKYFTSLSAWRIDKADKDAVEQVAEAMDAEVVEDGLPF